jgi:hypothetical protein
VGFDDGDDVHLLIWGSDDDGDDGHVLHLEF